MSKSRYPFDDLVDEHADLCGKEMREIDIWKPRNNEPDHLCSGRSSDTHVLQSDEACDGVTSIPRENH